MSDIIFNMKPDQEKFQLTVSHLNWLVEQYQKNKEELDEYRAGTKENKIINEKNEQINKLEYEIRDLRSKELDYIDFGFDEDELKRARKWERQHLEEAGHGVGCSGGNFSYIITPTGLGIIKEVKCICGASYTIQDLM